MTTERGIIIIAGGHPVYGQMAANNAVSIRRSDPEIPILIYVTPGSMNERITGQLQDKCNIAIEMLPDETYLVDGIENYLRPKVFIDKLSPFDETIFLDADMMWLGTINPGSLFDQLKDEDFTMSNEGYIDTDTEEGHHTGFYTTWAKYADIKKVFSSRLGSKLYQLRSEFIYFKKTKRVKSMFSVARKIYDNPKTRPELSGGNVPDEYAFNVASSTCGLYPHRDKWTPAFWEFRHRMVNGTLVNTHDIAIKFALLSIGGNRQGKTIKKYYSDMSQAHFKHFGLNGWEAIPDKADILPSRRKQ